MNLRAAGLSETTIQRRTSDMEQIAREVGPGGPDTITGEKLVQWMGDQVWAIETRRGRRNSARSFWKWAVAAGVVTENAAEALPKIAAAKPSPRPAPDRIYRGALQVASPRVRLMLRLAAEIGLRRAEIAVVHVGNDLIEGDEGYSLVVHGKGNKKATMPVPDDLGNLIAAGAPAHSPGEGHPRRGYLFPGAEDGHLSPRWVGRLCAEALAAAAYEGEAPWTVHKLRHRFGTRALKATRDILAVRDAMRHSSVATTQAYCAVEQDAVRAAVNAAA
ncbi:tyrosine-type recombinase/integrase [Amycolatopsis sp. NPDC051716]|uniref:tyrosine-type recombinase/integrase n=1 Tax=Actinomycetes TaxID=1760 RepID=UPI0034143815